MDTSTGWLNAIAAALKADSVTRLSKILDMKRATLHLRRHRPGSVTLQELARMTEAGILGVTIGEPAEPRQLTIAHALTPPTLRKKAKPAGKKYATPRARSLKKAIDSGDKPSKKPNKGSRKPAAPTAPLTA
jgi:hypothetical protein